MFAELYRDSPKFALFLVAFGIMVVIFTSLVLTWLLSKPKPKFLKEKDSERRSEGKTWAIAMIPMYIWIMYVVYSLWKPKTAFGSYPAPVSRF